MSSRGSKQSGGGSSGLTASGSGSHAKKNNKDSVSGTLPSGGDQPEEDPLVAVLLADSYDNHFAPLTLNWPRCLLPLANVPLLHYSVESATRAGVSHIYVLTRAHAHLIRQHVNDHLQNLLHSQGIAITVMSTPEARSEGDAIRELDAKQVLRSDFLLYRSDSVCTMDLRPVVDLHRRRRTVDKDAIMTMCCMQAGDHTTMRSKAMRPVQYIDPATNQILHYEQLPGLPKRKAVMPLELLRLDDKTGFDEIDVRFDLVEAGVYICSIDVPPLFSENFDYQSLSLDFIPGILTSDLLDSKIFLHVGKRGYGGRAQDTQTYDAISRDVLRRWTHPFTPASSAWLSERMTERRGWRYVGQDVQAHRSSNVGPCSMIASKCTLEPNVTITGSILCEGVQIGNGSIINKSHIHPSVIVGKQVKMNSLSLEKEQGYWTIKERESWDEEEEEETSKNSSSVDIPARNDARLGTESKGVLWTNLWQKKVRRQTGTEERSRGDTADEDQDNESVSSIAYDSEFGSDDDDLDGFSDDGRSTHSSSAFSHVSGTRGGITNLTLDDEVDTQLEKEAVSARLAEFENEARASLMRALEENHSIDNASLELKTLRMASNVSLRDVQKVVVETLLDRCQPTDPKAVQALVTRWGKLIAQVSQDDEMQAVVVMQSYCALHSAKTNLFVPLLKLFYNEDVVSDEAIVAWWRSKASQTGNEKMLDLRTRAQGVVRYILEDDDDDDEEDDDE
ncbi:hypothetical protein L7F22_042310 [Adiantum nelumboides]|nr:hypothetical protein [Adiantum nelumboides]